MKNRLEVARELLSDDGVIFVQCDDNEQAYLKVLMDEIFKRENFIANLVWKGRGGRQDSKFIAQIHETIVVFAKDIEKLKLNKRIVKDDSSYPYNDENGNYKLQLIRKWGSNSRREDRPNLFYAVNFNGKEIYPILPNGDDGCWRWNKERLEQAIKDDLVIALEKENKIELYEKIYEGNGFKETIFTSWIDESFLGEGAKQLENIFGKKVFDYPKPESLLKHLIEIATNPNDIVLDFCLGSGTTCAVAHKMGRRWIGIEQMDYIEDITKVRLQKVLDGEQGGISKAVNWTGGGLFVYFELKKYNQYFIDKILQAQTMGELDAVYNDMAKNAFFKFWFDKDDFQKQYKKDADDKQISLDDRKKILIEVLDENQLYLNYADMDDTRFNVSDDDKALSKAFYGA